MICPICKHPLESKVIRCPKCNTTLTFWVNLDMWAEQAHAAAIHAVEEDRLADASELLLRACVSAPDNAAYMADYGRLLAQQGRFEEAIRVLKQAHAIAPNEAIERAIAAAERASKGTLGAETDSTSNASTAMLFEGMGDAEVPAAWRLAFRIESEWERFAPFVDLLDWIPEDGDARDAIAYVRGLAAIAEGDPRAARDRFIESLDGDAPFFNADHRLLTLNDLSSLDETVDAILGRGRSPKQLVEMLLRAAATSRDARPEAATSMLHAAIDQALSDEADGAMRPIIAWMETHMDGSARRDVWAAAVLRSPTHDLLARLAHEERLLERYAEAAEAYTRAVEAAPESWTAREGLAWTLAELPDRMPDALREVDAALRAMPEDHEQRPRVEALRADIADRLERTASEEVQFEEADDDSSEQA